MILKKRPQNYNHILRRMSIVRMNNIRAGNSLFRESDNNNTSKRGRSISIRLQDKSLNRSNDQFCNTSTTS